MTIGKKIKPRVVVYDTQNKDRFFPLERDYKVVYSDPHYFKVAELKYDYFWSDRPSIIEKYREFGVPHIDTVGQPEEVVTHVEEQKEAVQEKEEVVAPFEEEVVESFEVDFDSMSWNELRKAAKDKGLEGQFTKDEALAYLKGE